MIKYNYKLLKLDYLKANGLFAPLDFATITYAAQYNPDDVQAKDAKGNVIFLSKHTLILGSETLTFSLSGNGLQHLTGALNIVRLKYAGRPIGTGDGYFTVDSYRRRHTAGGFGFRTEATCTAVSAYGAALSIPITYNKTRPTNETAYQFISQFISVTNWPGGS